MKRLEIIPIEYGKSVLPESMIFQNGAENILLCCAMTNKYGRLTCKNS